MATRSDQDPVPYSHLDLALIFIKLGVIGFGGPAAHLAMMRSEFVDRKRWLSEAEFLDLVGTSNLLPGPSSTEVAIFIGLRMGGFAGLLLAGMCFITPAAVIVSLLCAVYVRYGHLPAAISLLYGIKPVIIAIIFQAVFNLGRTALKSAGALIAAALVLVLSFCGAFPVLLLFACGLSTAIGQWFKDRSTTQNNLDRRAILTVCALFALPVILSAMGINEPLRPTLLALFLIFVKIGCSVFGSGYVLLAFVKTDLVTHLHWLTNTQLLDAVSVGQFTPGPVFTTATFIGYLLKGPIGAVVATVGIFLPAFLLVAITGRLVGLMRSSLITGAFLDGINAAAVALMTFAGIQLSLAALIDLTTALIALASSILLIRFRVNSALIILIGAITGFLVKRLI